MFLSLRHYNPEGFDTYGENRTYPQRHVKYRELMENGPLRLLRYLLRGSGPLTEGGESREERALSAKVGMGNRL